MQVSVRHYLPSLDLKVGDLPLRQVSSGLDLEAKGVLQWEWGFNNI